RFLPFYLMIRHGVRKLVGSSFLFLDEKKRTKEKSRQNNASTLKATTRPLFCPANAQVES
ncbi:MAG: hypothetical protein KAI45_04435, partial [Melioribacteraceae bacterium]|nr:hypothetical protein [Melioribacteraceae bacterium]